jgi:hypothetical protein
MHSKIQEMFIGCSVESSRIELAVEREGGPIGLRLNNLFLLCIIILIRMLAIAIA